MKPTSPYNPWPFAVRRKRDGEPPKAEPPSVQAQKDALRRLEQMQQERPLKPVGRR